MVEFVAAVDRGIRSVLFHGTELGDLYVLEPVRHSRDATPFGDQDAVFAASETRNGC
jgi:hypothetical protein